MTVLQVKPNNPLKAGVMIEAFANTHSGETVQIPVILMTRAGKDVPVAQESMHRLAKAFEASMNGNAVPTERIVQPGHAFHYRLSEEGTVLSLHHRKPSDVLTQGGSNSLPGVEFRIMDNAPDELRADLVRKMGTPTVIQAMLDALQEIGPAPRQGPKPGGPAAPALHQ